MPCPGSGRGPILGTIHEFPHPRIVVHHHPTRKQFTLDEVHDALEQEVHALELDLYFRREDGQVVCNHDGPTAASPTLEQALNLVLGKKRDTATVHDDGCQFFLVLEPKTGSTVLFEAILEILRRYDRHLSTAVSEGDAAREITVVIAGAYTHEFYAHLESIPRNRLCIVEEQGYDGEIVNLAAGQPPFQWVTLKSGVERGRVNDLHAGTDTQLKGRYNVRVWNCAPQDFGPCLASGVDAINCDLGQAPQLKRLIQNQSPRGRFPALAVNGSQALLTWRCLSSNHLYLALGTVERSGLNLPRQILLPYLLPDECLALAPAGALTADGVLLVLYEVLSDYGGLLRLWHRLSQRLPQRLGRFLRRPQSLRYVAGRFASYERFVTFDGREHQLTSPSGVTLRGRDPDVAVGPGRRILIVYESAAGGGLHYASGTLNMEGEFMGQDHALVEGQVCQGRTPTVAADSAGRVVVVYQEPDDQRLMVVSGRLDSSGRIAGRPSRLLQHSAARGHTPSVALDGSGRLVVVYQETQSKCIWCVSGTLDEEGQVIGTAFPLTASHVRQGRHPTVAFDREGHVILLYEASDGHTLWVVHGPLRSGQLDGQARLLSIGMDRR